jgi:transcriptional regulator with XRE-family HTH domain
MSHGDGIGKRIHQARLAKGVSKSRLARETGVTTTAVWNWEENEIAPRQGTLVKVAAYLGVSEDFLRTGRANLASAASSNGDSYSIAQMIEETRAKISKATGFALDRIKLHLELVAD